VPAVGSIAQIFEQLTHHVLEGSGAILDRTAIEQHLPRLAIEVGTRSRKQSPKPTSYIRTERCGLRLDWADGVAGLEQMYS